MIYKEFKYTVRQTLSLKVFRDNMYMHCMPPQNRMEALELFQAQYSLINLYQAEVMMW